MLGWARRLNLRAAHVPRQMLPQGAKTRVRVFADIQNFALCAHCVRSACTAFPVTKCRFRLAWVWGGGVGGHSSEHRAETWTMHGTEHCTGDHRLFRI